MNENEFKAILEYNFESKKATITKSISVNGLNRTSYDSLPFNTENTSYEKCDMKDNIIKFESSFCSEEELDEFISGIKTAIPLEDKMMKILKKKFKDKNEVKSFGVTFVIEEGTLFAAVDINDKDVLDWDFVYKKDEFNEDELLDEILDYSVCGYYDDKYYDKIINNLDCYEKLNNDPDDFTHKNTLQNNSYRLFRQLFETRCASVLKQYNNDKERAFDEYSMKNNILNYIRVYIENMFDLTIANREHYSKKELNRLMNLAYESLQHL